MASGFLLGRSFYDTSFYDVVGVTNGYGLGDQSSSRDRLEAVLAGV